MSDSDEYVMDEDEEEYDFEYSDDDGGGDDDDVDAENSYYNAKGLKEDSLDEAAAAFLKIVDSEKDSERTVWGFKALKQLIKVYGVQNSHDLLVSTYTSLLLYISTNSVTQNVAEKAINGILDRLTQGSSQGALMHRIYSETLSVFSTAGTVNERLWFKCSLKLGQLLLDLNDVAKFQVVIKNLLKASANGVESTNQGQEGGIGSVNESEVSGVHLMEIYALQIQLFSKTKNNKKLKELYAKATSVQNNVPHPRTLAIIYECGGKMYMGERSFEKAKDAFLIAFKGFDEAGDNSRLRVLKYLLMASMLHASAINPLDSPEARPYKDAGEIVIMTKLVGYFHDNEISKFEGVLRRNEGGIMDDEFVAGYMDDLLNTVRTQVLVSVLEPFERVTMEFLGEELNGVGVEEVEKLLVTLILDGRLKGKIDQKEGVLVLERKGKKEEVEAKRVMQMNLLAKTLGEAVKGIDDSVPGKGAEGQGGGLWGGGGGFGVMGGGFGELEGFDAMGGMVAGMGERGWRGRFGDSGRGGVVN